MPFITVNTSMTLSKEKKDEIKSGLGSVVHLIPGKTEPLLMVDISDGHTMYLGGKQIEKCTFVDVKCYKSAPFEADKQFTEAVFKLMEQSLGVTPDQMYMSINEMPIWGSKGTLK